MSDNSTVISYEQISEVDVDHLLESGVVDMEAHFADIAERATAGQLRLFLDVLDRGVGDEEDKPHLSRMYVERRMDTIGRMLSMRM